MDKALGDQIRTYHLAGVKVDEDYKRYYPYDSLASKVLGFTGGDNQGIIGLEVKYEDYLKGMNGKILTMSDAAGIEIENAAEDRIEPIAGQDLHVSLDVNIQKYCEQAAYQVMEKKGAKRVSIIVMNPQNGYCKRSGIQPKRPVHASRGPGRCERQGEAGAVEPDVA